MKTIEVTLYKFAELSDSAKQRVIKNETEIAGSEDFWYAERSAAFKAANKIYNQLHNISNGYDSDTVLSGARLYTYIVNNFAHLWERAIYYSKHAGGKFKKSDYGYKYDNPVKVKRSNILTENNLENCPLTGVCYDMDFLQPIIDFLKKPDSHTTNFDLTIPDLQTISDRDFEYETSEAAILEGIENSDYDYTVEGEIWS